MEAVGLIEEKIHKLIRQRDLCKEKTRDLQAQLKAREEEVSQLRAEIDTLEQSNQSLKTANAMLGSSEYKRETKLKINSLIREIDQCIVQLSE